MQPREIPYVLHLFPAPHEMTLVQYHNQKIDIDTTHPLYWYFTGLQAVIYMYMFDHHHIRDTGCFQVKDPARNPFIIISFSLPFHFPNP